MSLVYRRLISLTCDAGCGARLDTDRESQIAARVDAGLKGWRYAEGIWLCNPDQQKDWHRRNGTEQTLRSLDVCPDCQVPEPGSRITRAEAALVASERRSPQAGAGAS